MVLKHDSSHSALPWDWLGLRAELGVAGAHGVQTFLGWWPIRKVGTTKFGLGEEAAPCFCLLAAGKGLHRGERKTQDGLSSPRSLAPFATSREF